MPAVAADNKRDARTGQGGDAGIGRGARAGEPLRRDAVGGRQRRQDVIAGKPSWRGATMRSAAPVPFAGLFR